MENKKIRVAIIGTGFGAKVHAPIMQSHSGFEVVAISSVHRGNVDQIKQETGIAHVYEDWKQMLDNESIDLLSVASAPYLHHEMVLEGLKRNLHIYCEKPMAFDAEQSKDMLELKDEAGLFRFINFEFRFLPARQKVKEIFASGKLGKIMHIHYKCNYNSYLSLANHKRGWLGQEQFGGGMLGAIGSHMFDSLLWWTGDQVKDVYGQLPIHVPTFSNDEETETRTAEDSFQAVGSFQSGSSFLVDFSSSSRHKANQWRLEVFGTNGTLIMTDDQHVEVAIGEEELAPVELPPRLEEPASMSQRALAYYQAFYPMLDEVYQTLTENKLSEKVPTFENGHAVQGILDAIRQSAKEGRKVVL